MKLNWKTCLKAGLTVFLVFVAIYHWRDAENFAGVLLSALGIYGPFADFARAGATVPLTGFGHALAQGAIAAVQEKGWLGAFTGGLTATAGGIAAAVFFGFITALIFKPKPKP